MKRKDFARFILFGSDPPTKPRAVQEYQEERSVRTTPCAKAPASAGGRSTTPLARFRLPLWRLMRWIGESLPSVSACGTKLAI